MLGISLVVKDSAGIIHEGKDFGDYGYVRGYNSGGFALGEAQRALGTNATFAGEKIFVIID